MKSQESKPSTTSTAPLEVPHAVAQVLKEYRLRVRLVRLTEAVCAVAIALSLSYLSLFILDRVSDTSRWLRAFLWIAGMSTLVTWLPWIVYRWVWQSRRLDQVARILKTQQPRTGDHLLGIVELAQSNKDMNQSEVLVRAALQQADREMSGKSFVSFVPRPRHRQWGIAAGCVFVVLFALLVSLPSASMNAFHRWLKPWASIERFTFAKIEPIPNEIVVPDSEESSMGVDLKSDSKWVPVEGSIRIGNQLVKSNITDGHFDFRIPPQKKESIGRVRIGDVFAKFQVKPEPRPELGDLVAQVTLPSYLQRTGVQNQSIRGGAFNTVKGSVVQVNATSNRELISAHFGDADMEVSSSKVKSPPFEIQESKTVKLTWQDHLGLTPSMPLKLQFNVSPDAAPSVEVRDLKTQTVMMEQSILTFKVNASDDYGIQRLGLKWNHYSDQGTNASESSNSSLTKVEKPSDAYSKAEGKSGEQIIYTGGPDKNIVESLNVTLSPNRDRIEPQSIELRLFAEDYLPDRPRQYSSPIVIHILSEADHATWLLRRIEAWMRQCIENYDREQQAFHRNQEVSRLPREERTQSKSLRSIERQATTEQSQAKRLRSLNETARQVVIDCTENKKISPKHLDQLSALIAELMIIADQKMPLTAKYLQNASKQASQVDVELDKALVVQDELLAQYQSIVERMRALMRKIEGTSFATRLQALSREEIVLGGDVRLTSSSEFGKHPTKISDAVRARLKLLVARQGGLSKLIQELMADMEGALERSPSPQVKEVLDEMSSEEILAKGKFIAEQISQNDSGVSVAQCEFLADSFYRWAEQLMLQSDSDEEETQGKNGSLPPELAVELMRILKRETDLREETRELEQSKPNQDQPNQDQPAFTQRAKALAKTQVDLAVRTAEVVKRVMAIPNGEEQYSQDIERLTNTIAAMRDAEALLNKHETSSATIAAETEAIELLQNSKKGKSSKGGGGTGGGDGQRSGTDFSALADMLNSKPQDNLNRTEKSTELSTGNESDRVPEEFRSGLERLYEAMEKVADK